MTPSTAIVSKRMGVVMLVNGMVENGRSFDSIRIEEICQRAQISRSTFYRLFQDKYSIPSWCYEVAFRTGLAQIGRTLNALQGNAVTLQGIALFKDLFMSAGHAQGKNTFRSLIMLLHADAMRVTLRDYKGQTIDTELEFQIRLVADSQANAVGWWLDGSIGCTSDRLAELMVAAMPQRIYSLINEPSDPKDPPKLTYMTFTQEANRL